MRFSTSVLLLVLAYALRRVTAISTALGKSSNTSVTSTTKSATDSCLDDYGGHCVAILAAEGLNFWPVAYTHIAATKYLIVDNNGTSTSMRYNTDDFTVPEADRTSYSVYGTFPKTFHDLTLSTFGTTLTWPTNYLAVAPHPTIIRNYQTTDSDGRIYCVHTQFETTVPKAIQTPDWQYVIAVPDSLATAGGGRDTEAQLNPQQMAEFGVDPAWNCSGGGTGIPLANIPVLSLTATSTITQSGAASATVPATPAEPASSIATVSETSKASATAISGQSTEPADPSATHVASTASVGGGDSTAIAATDTRIPPVSAPDTEPPATQAPGPTTPLGSNPSGPPGSDSVAGSHVPPPGSVATVSGTVRSTVPSNTIGAAASPSASDGASPEVSEIAQSEYLVGTQTLAPGGSAIVVAGKTLSLASLATELVVGGSTIALVPGQEEPDTVTMPLAEITAAPAAPAITLDGAIVTPNARSEYVIDGQTLVPGGAAITLSGTVLSLAPSGTALVLGSTTVALSPATDAAVVPVLTLDGSVITANAQSAFVVGTQTLVPGGAAVTVSGEVLSLASSAADLIVLSSPAPPAITSSALGLADVIMSAFGGEPSSRADASETLTAATASGAPGAVPFTGNGQRLDGKAWWSGLTAGLCAGLYLFTWVDGFLG